MSPSTIRPTVSENPVFDDAAYSPLGFAAAAQVEVANAPSSVFSMTGDSKAYRTDWHPWMWRLKKMRNGGRLSFSREALYVPLFPLL